MLTRRDRSLRLVGGLALIAAGFAAFAISKANDPANRAALLAILAILFGFTYVGQAIRGSREAPVRTAAAGRPLGLVPRGGGLLLAWLVPGLGHLALGRRGKGILFGTVILATFLAGLLLAEGRNLDYGRDKLYFIAYGWCGLPTLLGWFFTRNLERDHLIPFLNEGYLYTAVAGLLNAVAMMDILKLREPTEGAPA